MKLEKLAWITVEQIVSLEVGKDCILTKDGTDYKSAPAVKFGVRIATEQIICLKDGTDCKSAPSVLADGKSAPAWYYITTLTPLSLVPLRHFP